MTSLVLLPGSAGRLGGKRCAREEDFSTEQPTPEEDARLPRAHAQPGGPPGAEAAAPEGSQAPRALTEQPGRQTLGRAERLRQKADFDRVFREGARVEGPLLILLGRRSEAGLSRLGLAVSRRVCGAVLRTRLRRLLREAFRRHKQLLASPLDLVAMPRARMGERGQAEVDDEYRRLVGRLRDRLGRKPAAPRD